MRQLASPRPHGWYVGTRTTLGARVPNIPSRSHPAWLGGGVFPGGTPTNWTPHGVFVAGGRIHRPMPYSRNRSLAVERSPGAWWTPPALWNLSGIETGGALSPQIQQQLGLTRAKSSTPYTGTVTGAKHRNSFPGVAIPTPSYPLPAAFQGRL